MLLLRFEYCEKRVEVARPSVSLGRAPENDVVIGLLTIAQRHCEVRLEGDRLTCFNHSKNGKVFVGPGRRVVEGDGAWVSVPLDQRGEGVLDINGTPVRVTVLSMATAAVNGPSVTGGPESATTRDAGGRMSEAEVLHLYGLAAPQPYDLASFRVVEVVLGVIQGLMDGAQAVESGPLPIAHPLSWVLRYGDSTNFLRALLDEARGASMAQDIREAVSASARREAALLCAMAEIARDLSSTNGQSSTSPAASLDAVVSAFQRVLERGTGSASDELAQCSAASKGT